MQIILYEICWNLESANSPNIYIFFHSVYTYLFIQLVKFWECPFISLYKLHQSFGSVWDCDVYLLAVVVCSTLSDPRNGKIMEEFYNENQDYKDDFIYSYGNAKQGKDLYFCVDLSTLLSSNFCSVSASFSGFFLILYVAVKNSLHDKSVVHIMQSDKFQSFYNFDIQHFLNYYSFLYINIVIKTMKKVLEKQESNENDRSKGDDAFYYTVCTGHMLK